MAPLLEPHLLASHYNPSLVILSVLIAILASYVALDLAGRMAASQGQGRRWWLVGGAMAMGTGIWSMHFIGMLAFSLPMPIRYHIPTVIISHIAAVLASGVALYVVSRHALEAVPFFSGGVLMGMGITAMHYIGMAAMRLSAKLHYDMWLVGLSIVIAIGASLVGLWIAFHLRSDMSKIGMGKKVLGAIVLGSAIPAMHYTGMAAASFSAVPSVVGAFPHAVDISSLGGTAIFVGAFFVLGFTLLTSMVDRRFSGQATELFEINERLQLEIKERDRIENELRVVRGELEQRVIERTAELSEANTRLKKEMSGREKAQEEIASLAKFPDENPNPIFRMTPDGRILYKNKASSSLLNQRDCWEDQKIRGWAYEAAQKAFDSHQPVQIEVECGDRVFSVTFAPIRESDYINVYALDITERRLAEEESHALMNNLGERVKELTALHQTARLVQDPNAAPREIVERFVELIPAAWRYPDITGAHVLYDSIEVATKNFASTPWIQSAEFKTGDGKRGVFEVCYLAEKPNLDEGPFLNEERNLLNSLTEMLRTYFEAKRVTRDLEVRFQFENLLTSISTKFINLPAAEFETGIIEALGDIGTFANVDRSYIYQFSEDGVWAYLTHEWDADGVSPAGEQFGVLPTEHFPWSLQQLSEGKPVHIPRISELPPEAIGEKEVGRVGEIKSLIFVPMIRGETLVGLMGFSSLRHEKYWEEDHVALLRIVGEIFTNALDRKHTDEKQQRMRDRVIRQQEALLSLGREPVETLESTLQRVTEAVAKTLEVERVSIWIYDEHRTGIRCLDLFQLGKSTHEREAFLSASQYPEYFKALDQSLTLAAHDAHRDPRTREFAEGYLDLLGISAMLDAPIRHRGQTIGVVCHEHVGSNREWTLDEQNFSSSVADFVSLTFETIERKRAEEALRKMNDELEQRVLDRTLQLSKANTLLTQEIAERQRGEEALRRAEEKYHSIVENAVEGIYQSTPDGRFISVNPSLANMYGYSTPEEMISAVSDIERQVYVDPSQRKNFIKFLSERGSVEGFECQIYHKDGGVFWISEYARAVKDEQGHLRYYEGTVQDISSRKQAEEELQRAKEAAETASRAKTEFLANMSHELRTPLNGILGYAQILKRDTTLTDAQQSGVDIMQRSGEHLLMLINDILDLSKIEAQKLEIQPTTFFLPDFLGAIADLIHIRAEQASLAFHYEPAGELPKVVFGDEKRLRQVLLNLLGNAVKFTERGRVTLKVGYDRSKSNNKLLKVQVVDTGIGIPSEHLEEIFKPFRQVSDRSRQVEGTGLGLAITKRLVALMGGNLSVTSTPDQGSIFSFSLPLPEKEPDTLPSPRDPRHIIGIKGDPKHVLVVDDKWENRSVVANILAPLGFRVSEARNGSEGLTKALEDRPDMILMDLVMPVMDGFESTRRIRKTSELKAVIIIALSASVFEENRRKSHQAGCNDFLPKPLRAESLLEKIHEYLGLEWVYETERPTVSPKKERDKTFVSPPSEELAPLREAVKKGRILAIREHIDRIDQLGPSYVHFVAELRRLTKGYQLKQLTEFLNQYLEVSSSKQE